MSRLFKVARLPERHKIVGFRGKFYWLGNAHPVLIEYQGHHYSSVQDALTVVAPAGSTPLALRVDKCGELLKLKFSNVALRRQLLKTGDAVLVNQYEVGQAPDTTMEEKRLWGVVGKFGMNVLGQLLMRLRDQLRAQE